MRRGDGDPVDVIPVGPMQPQPSGPTQPQPQPKGLGRQDLRLVVN